LGSDACIGAFKFEACHVKKHAPIGSAKRLDHNITPEFDIGSDIIRAGAR
jgi:hypothetical protein